MKVAAVLAWIAGFGFGLPCIYAIWYFADHGQVWTFLDFPTYGDGPFADNGIRTTIPLLVAFLVVCAAEVVLGWLLLARATSWLRTQLGAAPGRTRVLDRL